MQQREGIKFGLERRTGKRVFLNGAGMKRGERGGRGERAEIGSGKWHCCWRKPMAREKDNWGDSPGGGGKGKGRELSAAVLLPLERALPLLDEQEKERGVVKEEEEEIAQQQQQREFEWKCPSRNVS